MKKLLLILSAVFVSVSIRGEELDPNTGWDNLNPYAYDLKSEVINNGQTLRLTYKFNAPGFGNGDEYNKLNPKDGTGTGRGIQIYLLYKDADGNFQRVTKDNGEEYRIVTGGYNKAQEWSVEVNVSDIPNNCKGKELTWEARVHGNIGRTTPKVVKASGTKPTNAYGIAVNKDPMHVRFAQMFVSEAYPNKRGGWDKHDSSDEYANANTMLEYSPWLTYVCAHHKHYHDGNPSHFASSWANGSVYSYTNSYNNEPNRVKISDDGRMFVSSFHPHASCAVVEYGRNRNSYDDAYKYYSVINNNWRDYDDLPYDDTYDNKKNPFLYRRCIGMDVKGSGENLKIILLWIDANGSTYEVSSATKYCAKFEIWEYEVGRAEKEGYINSTCLYLPPFDTSNGYVRKIGEYTDWDFTGADGGGAFYQGVIHKYNNMYRGFADLVYGTNNDVWVKIDYCFWRTSPGKIIRVKLDNGNATKYTLPTNTEASGNGGFYGGNAILVKDDLLFTSSTKNTIKAYQIDVNTGNLVLENSSLKEKYTITDSQIGQWVTGLTMDYAGNLYALARATENEAVCTLNVLGIAMPYKTKTAITTRARGIFVVNDPIPNILATDLRYEPAGTKDAYKFSFKVNTKPSIAQIRFYKKTNQSSMNSNIATIHADYYKKGQVGHETQNPDYVYTFPAEELKQGLMSVTFKMLGGDANSPTITDALPPGELCWSVYVEAPRQSAAIAPIYREEVTFNLNVSGQKMRKHIVVNNFPETDWFGAVIAANYEDPTTTSTTGVLHQERGLLFYGINDQGIDDSATPPTENNSTNNRYTLLPIKYLNGATSDQSFLNYPRRMAVAPDGKIYIADEGATGLPENKTFHNEEKIWTHQYGGIKIWDPAQPNKFSLFSNNKINTSTGVALWGETLYAVNTYPEFTTHSDGIADSNVSHYTSANQKGKYGWNGFVEYPLEKYVAGGTWQETDTIHHPLGQGDASGNFSIVAMEQGIWLCQHREHNVALKDAISQPLADNQEAICISFIPYNSNTRTWKSSWVNGKKGGSDESKRSLFSQTTTAPVQSTPGGGMAYRKVKVSDTEYNEYIYVPNHDGNIAEVRITSWANPGTANARPVLDTANVKIIETPSAVKGDHDVTGTTNKWHAAAITSMDFDYAGNLVLTIGPGNHSSSHALMIYTMPYDRTNAQEIRAPESCIYIPERLHQIGMDKDDIQAILDEHHNSQSEGKCAIDLYRPLQGGMFNTLCLPFTVPMDHENNPLAGSEVREFTRATIESIGGENILCLEFTEVNEIHFNVPYIIKPQQNIKQIMRFNWPVTLAEDTKVDPKTSIGFDNGNTITYQGILPQTEVSVQYDEDRVTPLTLILVAENRLAELLPDAGQTTGTINGLRGYFQLAKKLQDGTILQITPKQPASTSTTIIVDGKRVNIEKYLREGRVYIRMGDTLYTIDGQKVQ